MVKHTNHDDTCQFYMILYEMFITAFTIDLSGYYAYYLILKLVATYLSY